MLEKIKAFRPAIIFARDEGMLMAKTLSGYGGNESVHFAELLTVPRNFNLQAPVGSTAPKPAPSADN